MEGVAVELDCVALEAEAVVRVCRCCHADAGMAGQLLDDFDQYFSQYIGSHNGVPGVEVGIPNTAFDILNQYPIGLVEP